MRPGRTITAATAMAVAALALTGVATPGVAAAAPDFIVTATTTGWSPNTINLTKVTGNTIEFRNQSGDPIEIVGGDLSQPANSKEAVVVNTDPPGNVFPCDGVKPCIEDTGSGTLTVEVKRPGLLIVQVGTSLPNVIPLYFGPTKVQNLAVQPGDTELTVTWQAPAETYGWAVTLYDVLAEPSKQRCTVLPPALTCTLTGLTNGVQQTVSVTANTAGGSSQPASAVGTPASRPGSPKNVTATAGDASATVTWSAPDDTGGAPITKYTVIALINGVQTSQTCTTTSATSCTVTGLTNGTQYTMGVIASNAGGSSNVAVSNTVTPFSPPSTPVLTTAWDAVAGVMTVSWSPYDWAGNTPGSFTVEYRYRNGPWRGFNNTASPLAESAQFTTLSAGTPVEFRVTAVAQDGTTSTPGTASATIPNPGVPLTIVAGDTKADFSWKPVAGADHYIFSWYEWAPGTPGGTARIDSCTSDPCTYSLTGLTNGTQYRAKVNAIGANGRVVAVTDPDPYFTPNAPAPAALPKPSVAVSLTGTTARIDWAPYNWGSYTKSKYEIRWSTDGTNWNPVDNSASPLAESATITGLTPGSTTNFEVRAIPTSGAPSEWGRVSARIPTPPVSLTISAVGVDSAIDVSWQPVPGAATYQVGYYIPADKNSPIEVIPGLTCATGPCTVRIPNLVNGTTYTVNMNSFRADGSVVVASNYVTTTPLAPAAPLDVVYPVQANLQVGRSITISPDAQYSSGNPTSFTEGSTPLPSGLHLDPKNGDITGTPLQVADGLFPIKVANAAGQTLTVPLRLIIGPHTVSLSYADVSGHVGTPLTLTPHTSSVIGTMKDYRIASGTLPAGMTLDSTTGVISGTPTAATTGPVVLTVTARDDYATTSATFSITVDAGAAALTLGYPNVVAHVGKAQGVTPTVSGATGTLAFSLTSGTLPAGLALNAATGVISGTPTTAHGPRAVTVQVTDGSTTDDVTFTIEVIAHTLSLAYPSSSRDIGVPAQLSPVVSHIEGTVSYAITSGTLPAGLTLNPATGVISGTPTAVTSGPVPLEITATDSYASATAVFTIQVTDPTPALPVINATMTRDVDRLTVIGSVANAAPGDLVTPMFKLTGQDAFSPGVPVALDANGAFTWTRKVNVNKSARIYFMVQSSSSAIMAASRPSVTTTGSRSGTDAIFTGTTVNIRAGSVVHPWVKINGGKAFKGTPTVVGAAGSFTFTYPVAKSDSIRVKFNVRGIKSDPITL